MADLATDPFTRFRAVTRARIGLGRSGDAMPTLPQLEFQMAHALARDAVHGEVDWQALAAAMPMVPLFVRSQAADRAVYLRRPDLGRQLDPASADSLKPGDWDLALVVADGLSSVAVGNWAPPMAAAICQRLPSLKIAPPVLACQGRVALGDPIGEKLGAKMVAVLIGERPGLSVADSLGLYLTFGPRPGRRDSERNCISNIHADGLSVALAADKAAWLIREGLRRRLTGVDLKEETPTIASGGTALPASAGPTL